MLPGANRTREFGLFVQFFLEPILAVNESCHDVAGHIVARCVQHGGRGVYQVAQGNGDGQKVQTFLRPFLLGRLSFFSYAIVVILLVRF